MSRSATPASGYAVAGAAAGMSIIDGRIKDCRIAVAGVADAPFRAKLVEQMLEGQSAEVLRTARAAEHTVDGIEVLSDAYASSAYRSHLAKITVKRAMISALSRAETSGT